MSPIAPRFAETSVDVAELVINQIALPPHLNAFIEVRFAQQRVYLARIDRVFAHYHCVHIPLRHADMHGFDDRAEVAHHIFGPQAPSTD